MHFKMQHDALAPDCKNHNFDPEHRSHVRQRLDVMEEEKMKPQHFHQQEGEDHGNRKSVHLTAHTDHGVDVLDENNVPRL